VDFSHLPIDDSTVAFWRDVREFFETNVTEEIHDKEQHTGDGFDEQLHLKMAERGWIFPDWPIEEGGAGLDALRMRILNYEMARARTPDVSLGTTRLVAPTVRKHSPEDVKRDVLGRAAQGHVRFCLGYTEPDGGSDMANAKTRSVRDGDEWVINGAKMFTTGAHQCQYVFLVTRSNWEVPKHKGLTTFLVPLDAPGVDIHPIRTFGGERTNSVFFGDVRLSDRYRLGPVDDGWRVVSEPLDEEHAIGTDDVTGIRPVSPIGEMFVHQFEPAYQAAVEWAREPGPDGRRPADDPLVLARLGRVALDLEVSQCAPGPIGRVVASDTFIRNAADLEELVGPRGLIERKADGVVDGGFIEWAHRFAHGTGIYGGTSDIFRNIIAQRVLGLPRQTPKPTV
jgi:alkylation response protein AidB-like acyl-CoA dehydrogenase